MSLYSKHSNFSEFLLFLLYFSCLSLAMRIALPTPAPGYPDITMRDPVTVQWERSLTEPPNINIIIYLMDSLPRTSFVFAINVPISAGYVTSLMPQTMSKLASGQITNMMFAAIDALNSSFVLARSPTFQVVPPRLAEKSPSSVPVASASIASSPSFGTPINDLPNDGPFPRARNVAPDTVTTSVDSPPYSSGSGFGDPATSQILAPESSSGGVFISASDTLNIVNSAPSEMPGVASLPQGHSVVTTIIVFGSITMTMTYDPASTDPFDSSSMLSGVPKQVPMNAIVGGTVGAGAFVVILICFLIFGRIKRRRKEGRENMFGITSPTNGRMDRPPPSSKARMRSLQNAYPSRSSSMRNSTIGNERTSYPTREIQRNSLSGSTTATAGGEHGRRDVRDE